MNEPKVLNVGTEETTAKEKGDSGLSSAQVGTEAKTVEKASEEPKGVYVANENVVNDNSKALRTSKEAPKGRYVAPTEKLGGFERSAGEKGVVNTITVDEVKALIKQYGGGSGDTYTKEEIDHIVETMRKGLYQEVDTTQYPTLEDFLDSDGEEGIIYLYPVGNEGNNYYQYIWETTKEWISLGTTVVDLSQYAKLTLLAPIYDSTATYSVGAKCVQNGKLYSANTNINTPEEFDATHWTEISISSGFVDLDSAQTIAGQKKFSNGIKANILKPNSNIGLNFTDVEATFHGTLIGANGTRNLGRSDIKWVDLYLSGKIKDGTNEFNADNVFNVINATDIRSDNQLTPAQYDLITNGKPTLVKGTLRGLNNAIYSPGSFYGNEYHGLVLAGSRTSVINSYFINNSRVIDIVALSSNQYMAIGSIRSFNNKTVPNYPTTNTSPRVLTIGANGGALSWDDPFNPTSVSLSDGGTISDTTLQANIQYHRPIVLNGFTCYFSCDDGTNYQYTSVRYDANANKNHINVITINKTTWVATFHTSDLTLN